MSMASRSLKYGVVYTVEIVSNIHFLLQKGDVK
jgi:hypothetical protein